MPSRSILWIACLILSTTLAAVWGQLPVLDAAPLLRVVLFAGIGLLGIPLVLLFPDLDRRRATILLLTAAVVLRVVLLPSPVSDDVNRYLWEGKLVLSGENPFRALADAPVWEDHRDDYWEAMNHRDRPTAYPPGIQWIMAGAVAVAYQPWSMKALALVGDLITLCLLLKLLALGRQPLRWAGFYAFNPIILIAFAAEAHFDSLMTAALMGMVLAEKQKKAAWTWLLFGLAIQIKLVCFVLAPLVLKRDNLRGLWALVLALLLPSLPFLAELDGWWKGVTTFSGGGSFNGPLLTAFSLAGFTLPHARLLTIACFGALCVGVWLARLRGQSLASASFTLLGGLLVCSPIVHFWYLAWVIPFAVLMPSFGWMTASVTMAGYFLAWRTQALHGWWGFDHRTAALLWLAPTIAFLLQNRQLVPRLKAMFRTQRPALNPTRLGAVIPTLNPDERLPELIRKLHRDSQLPLIIADSTPEGTPTAGTDARWIQAPLGRGNQIAAGIAELETEWILIAHADATPTEGWHDHLLEATRRHPNASMLVLGQRFDPSAWGTVIIEALNELRVIFGGVAFGDQTMVIRREALEQAGGFPAQPLMEDVEASLRLQTQGPVVYLGAEWKVCASKWKQGFRRRFGLVIRLMITYQLARFRGSEHAKSYSKKLYRDYYESPGSS